ncbi:MAG: mannose-1-phosphate guanylyltransferase [bacterium]|nr:mannose-1-phosphate guanylyltransferase [bacterium]
MLNVVIMAGGSGERFWPKSRERNPKQLLPIGSKNTMLQETVKRAQALTSSKNIFIVTRIGLENEIHKQVSHIPKENIIIEPFARNTAAAIGLANLIIQKRDKNSITVVLPADHIIKDIGQFKKTITTACIAAEEGDLVTIGIKPSYPETGYGYIHRGDKIFTEYGSDTPGIFKVVEFREKPDLKTAREYFKKGEYYWNSGMFVWTTKCIEEAFKKYMPELYNALKVIDNSLSSSLRDEVIKEEYEKLEKISIDYGVMERAKNVSVVEGLFDWNDVGSWLALEKVYKKDDDGNIVVGDYIGIDTKNCILIGDKSPITAIGVSDLIIVNTGDVVLVCKKTEAQKVKKLLENIKQNKKLSKLVK